MFQWFYNSCFEQFAWLVMFSTFRYIQVWMCIYIDILHKHCMGVRFHFQKSRTLSSLYAKESYSKEVAHVVVV